MHGRESQKDESQVLQKSFEVSKEEKLARVAESVLRVVAQRGLDGINFAQLSRSSGVSRSWIYKYGGSREDLVAFAVQYFGRSLLMSMGQSRKQKPTAEDWLDFHAEEFAHFVAFLKREPLVLSVYFRFRGSESILGQEIAKFEKLHDQHEGEELAQLFGVSDHSARQVLELIGNVRWGFAHSWVYGPLAHLITQEELKMRFRALLCALLGR